MKYTPLLTAAFIALALFPHWRCVPDGPNLDVRLDSLNNALLYSVDAYARIVTSDLDEVAESGFCWNKTGNPTINDAVMPLGKPLINTMNTSVGPLEPGANYYLRAYAKTAGGAVVYSGEKTLTTWDGKLQDAEGRQYTGVQIGNQGWMAENLRTTRYADGSPIDIGQGSNRTYWYGSGHAYVPNFDQDIDQDGDFDAQDSLLYVNQYGLLYSWYAANNEYDPAPNAALQGKKVRPGLRDVCPQGWHLPTYEEWEALRNYLAAQYGYDDYAHHLTATSGWLDGLNGLDTYGFRILPNGYWHEPSATHTNLIGRAAFLWNSSSVNDANGGYVQIDNFDKTIYTSFIGKSQHALCVRCLKNK